MNVMIVGGGGLLGQKLIEVIKRETVWGLNSVIRSGIADAQGGFYFDTSSRKAWKELMAQERWRPDVIINAAAMTDVDLCEVRRDEAWRSNVQLVEILVDVARSIDSHLIQISSDHVFDGTKGPYNESDTPNPINYYGKTKLAAENLCIRTDARYSILRTSWLYGDADPPRRTFIEWVIRNLIEERQFIVVADELGNPTATEDVAYAALRCIERNVTGVLNIAGPDLISRWDYAVMIAEAMGLQTATMRKGQSEELGRPAKRPLQSGLITLKAQTGLGIHPISATRGLQTLQILQNRRAAASYR